MAIKPSMNKPRQRWGLMQKKPDWALRPQGEMQGTLLWSLVPGGGKECRNGEVGELF